MIRASASAGTAVSKAAGELLRAGYLERDDDRDRRRRPLVLTDKGRQTFDAAMRLQAPWINRISAGVSAKDIGTVHRVMTALRKNLEGNGEPDERA